MVNSPGDERWIDDDTALAHALDATPARDLVVFIDLDERDADADDTHRPESQQPTPRSSWPIVVGTIKAGTLTSARVSSAIRAARDLAAHSHLPPSSESTGHATYVGAEGKGPSSFDDGPVSPDEPSGSDSARDLGTELQRLRAEQELLSFQRARAIVRAADGGHTQRWIAKALGTSQTDIHRTLRSARAAADVGSADSPREMALRLITGAIDRSTLIDRMATAAVGTSSPYDGDDGYRRGPWDEFRLAWIDGLVDDDVYEEVLARRSASGADDPNRD